MKKIILGFSLSCLILSSCTTTNRFVSDKVVLGADMPIMFNETQVILHCNGPIYKGLVEISDNDTQAKLTYVKSDFESRKIGDIAITGRIRNVYFEDLETNTQQFLSDRSDLLIDRIQYLPEVKEKLGKGVLLYVLHEGSAFSTSSLYISNLNGGNFKRLNPEGESFEEGKWMDKALRFYFKTSKGVGLNGVTIESYYYIDFNTNPDKIISYSPVAE